MRLLLIGFPLPNPNFDNYSFLQAPSFYDYDAVVIEPAQVSKSAAAAMAERPPRTRG